MHRPNSTCGRQALLCTFERTQHLGLSFCVRCRWCPLERALCLQLRLIRRAFVNKMLDSSTFNKLLSAARECNRLLAEALRSKNQDREVCVQGEGGCHRTRAGAGVEYAHRI